MKLKQFDQQIQAMQRRLMNLHRSAGEAPQDTELLVVAFEELQAAIEELQAAEEELREKNQELLDAHAKAEDEYRRYQELFEYAPDGYLVTSLDGTIRQANRMAAMLLNTNERFMVGRSLALFIPEGERRAFRSELIRLSQADQMQELEVRLQPWRSSSVFDVVLRTTVARSTTGRPVGLRWLLSDITKRKRNEQDMCAQLARLKQRVAELSAQPEQSSGPHNALSALPQDQRADHMRQHYAFLTQASIALAVAPDYETAFAQVVRLAVPAMADLCIADILQEDGTIRHVAMAHADKIMEDLAHKLRDLYHLDPHAPYSVTYTLHTGEPQICSNFHEVIATQLAGDHECQRLIDEFAPISTMIVPLCSRERALGALTFVRTGSEASYRPDDIALVEELARHAAGLVDTAQRYDKN